MDPNSPNLTTRERVLYHQVHPLKLATDISTAVASLVLLSRHRLLPALFIMWVPSIAVTALMIRFGRFSKTKNSRVGAYLRRYMTDAMQGVRFLGLAIAAIGAWMRAWGLIPLGVAVIAWGWSGGWLVERLRRAS